MKNEELLNLTLWDPHGGEGSMKDWTKRSKDTVQDPGAVKSFLSSIRISHHGHWGELNNRPLTYVKIEKEGEVLTQNVIMWGQDVYPVEDIEYDSGRGNEFTA